MPDAKVADVAHTILLASTINWPVASRMAIRFAQAGCRVAAIYPSNAHPLAVTQSVSAHYRFSLFRPQRALLRAIRASGAQIVLPCDDGALDQMHGLYAELTKRKDGDVAAKIIERSLGDPRSFPILASRHAVQCAARAEGLSAAESAAIEKLEDFDLLANSTSFPWMVKTDHSWGGVGVSLVSSVREARSFMQRAGVWRNLPSSLKQLFVNGNRFWLRDLIRQPRSAISVQRIAPGQPANTVVSCWEGEVLALISVQVLNTTGLTGPAASVRIFENKQMEETVRRMVHKLGLSGFHGFDFVLDEENGDASLIEINSRCAPPCHLNAGPEHDLVAAYYRRWRGISPRAQAALHQDRAVIYFPQCWQADPTHPMLDSPAHDAPQEDPQLSRRLMQLARRDSLYAQFKADMTSLLKFRRVPDEAS
jgi:hypothetical protein